MKDGSFIDLVRLGWKVTRGSDLNIPEALITRYKSLPADLLDFYHSYSICENEQKTVWFITSRTINEETEDGFKWNEFELISLDSADDDEHINSIRSFWDKHIPLIQSVENGYEFYAVSVDKESYGSIVHGIEPEFEDVSIVARNLSEFIRALCIDQFN